MYNKVKQEMASIFVGTISFVFFILCFLNKLSRPFSFGFVTSGDDSDFSYDNLSADVRKSIVQKAILHSFKNLSSEDWLILITLFTSLLSSYLTSYFESQRLTRPPSLPLSNLKNTDKIGNLHSKFIPLPSPRRDSLLKLQKEIKPSQYVSSDFNMIDVVFPVNTKIKNCLNISSHGLWSPLDFYYSAGRLRYFLSGCIFISFFNGCVDVKKPVYDKNKKLVDNRIGKAPDDLSLDYCYLPSCEDLCVKQLEQFADIKYVKVAILGYLGIDILQEDLDHYNSIFPASDHIPFDKVVEKLRFCCGNELYLYCTRAGKFPVFWFFVEAVDYKNDVPYSEIISGLEEKYPLICESIENETDLSFLRDKCTDGAYFIGFVTLEGRTLWLIVSSWDTVKSHIEFVGTYYLDTGFFDANYRPIEDIADNATKIYDVWQYLGFGRSGN